MNTQCYQTHWPARGASCRVLSLGEGCGGFTINRLGNQYGAEQRGFSMGDSLWVGEKAGPPVRLSGVGQGFLV